MLRNLAVLGRNAGTMLRQAGSAGQNGEVVSRWMTAAAPTVSLEQYVQGLRSQIADAYNSRVEKYDAYVAAFEEMLATTGLPRAHDFAAVKQFAQKRSDILNKVGFPDDWKVSGAQADDIKALLSNIPVEKKALQASGAQLLWYHNLTDDQIKQCSSDPQLFMELKKLHAFEEQFTAGAAAQASRFNLPPVTLDDLPHTLDPEGEHVISAKEVKWIVQKAREDAERIRKTDPRFVDPFNTPEFEQAQKDVANRFGISDSELAELQKDMTPAKWKQVAAAQGLAVSTEAGP